MYGSEGKGDTMLEIEIWAAPIWLKILSILGAVALCVMSMISLYFTAEAEQHLGIFSRYHDFRNILLHMYIFGWNVFLIFCEIPAPNINKQIFARVCFRFPIPLSFLIC